MKVLVRERVQTGVGKGSHRCCNDVISCRRESPAGRAISRLPSAAASDQAERRRYFDTRLRSKSAAGHDFPDELEEDEKLAVMEYLKTL